MNPSMKPRTPIGLFFLILSLPLLAGGAATEPSPKSAESPATPAVDFGDFSSQVLTSKAWEALGASNHAAVDAYVAKCVELYAPKAAEMQASLTEAAGAEKAKDYWALNDVGTCHFIRAQSKEARGDSKAALADYKAVSEKYSFAQCWDTKGWYWKPADAAKAKIKSLEFDALK
jgi:hypothetical protein